VTIIIVVVQSIPIKKHKHSKNGSIFLFDIILLILIVFKSSSINNKQAVNTEETSSSISTTSTTSPTTTVPQSSSATPEIMQEENDVKKKRYIDDDQLDGFFDSESDELDINPLSYSKFDNNHDRIHAKIQETSAKIHDNADSTYIFRIIIRISFELFYF
jgi:hypothetical protein